MPKHAEPLCGNGKVGEEEKLQDGDSLSSANFIFGTITDVHLCPSSFQMPAVYRKVTPGR